MIETRRSRRRSITAKSASVSSEESELVGSSMTRMRASRARARAISTSWREPGPSSATRVSGRSPGSRMPSAWRTRGRVSVLRTTPQRVSSHPSRMFCSTVRSRARFSSW